MESTPTAHSTAPTLRAPILIITCNRVGHLRALVESLGACALADETELYIAVDAPFAPSVVSANREILAFAESARGFRRVHVIRHERNVGPELNMQLGIAEVFANHETCIFLEDDNVVAGNFLLFMNSALQEFRSRPDCYSVCGYSWPVPKPAPCPTDVFTSPLVCAWGLGLFRDRYVRPDLLTGSVIDPFFLRPSNLWRILRLSPTTFSLYVSMFLSGQNFPDILMTKYSFRNQMFNVFPTDTKVLNRGFDGSGVHCPASTSYVEGTLGDSSKTHFSLDRMAAIDQHYSSAITRYSVEHFGHHLGRSMYSYALYLLCIMLGREPTVRLRDFVKSRLRPVPQNLPSP